MTQEEKAKRYDELAKEVKDFFEGKQKMYSDITQTLEYLFPEPKENEDEKIRKAIISGMTAIKGQGKETFATIHINDCIAWLEKQGKQKPQGKTALEAINEEKVDNRNCAKPVNNVESKFKVGDWVVHNDDGCICQIKSIREDDYCLWPLDSDIEGYLKITGIDNKYHLYDVTKDAKDGDVLANDDNNILILKELGYDYPYNGTPNLVKAYCGININGDFVACKDIWGFCYTLNVHPATKEQRDTLMKAMADAGYTFDFEKKELKKIKDETSIAVNNPDAYKIGFADGEAHAKEEQWKPSDEQIKHLTYVVYDAKHKNDISTYGYEPYFHLSNLLMQLKRLKG